jgi:hypothetical protein
MFDSSRLTIRNDLPMSDNQLTKSSIILASFKNGITSHSTYSPIS